MHYSAIHSKCLPPQARVPAYLRRRRRRFLVFFAATIEVSYGCSVSSQREYTPTESNPPGPAEMNALGEQKGNPPEKWDGGPKKKKKKKVDRQNPISASELWGGKCGRGEETSTIRLLTCLLTPRPAPR